MEDEITKHTKKIYNTVKDSKHTFGEKVREIIIEIFIIVFAVTLSIWLHSWSEHRHEQSEAMFFLNGLKEDLNKDIDLLEKNKSIINYLDSNYNFLLLLTKNQIADSNVNAEIHKHLIYTLTSTHPNNGRYDGFKSSGRLETIENDNLKENILVFYQQTLPKLISSEDYVNSLQLKILDLDIDKDNKMPIAEFVRTEKMQGLFGLGSHNFKVTVQYYDEAIKQAKEIISEIERTSK